MTTNKKTTARTCKVWNCPTAIRGFYIYCKEHNEAQKRGEIDDCPGCGRGKEAKYDTCSECRSSGQANGKEAGTKGKGKTYRREYSPAWDAADAEASEFYIYILKLDDGSFYAGQTREIRERLMEHRDGTTKSTAGKNPKLAWFSTVTSREEATGLEVKLKRLCDKNPVKSDGGFANSKTLLRSWILADAIPRKCYRTQFPVKESAWLARYVASDRSRGLMRALKRARCVVIPRNKGGRVPGWGK